MNQERLKRNKTVSMKVAVQIFGLLLLFLCISACSNQNYKAYPRKSFTSYTAPDTPDYTQEDAWAASPFKRDRADRVPDPSIKNRQEEAKADVFFVHTTTYVGDKGQGNWNAPINQELLNQRTDDFGIACQASAFNGAGRIFAPRYRQAHLHAFDDRDTESAVSALELAYFDIQTAFQHYLDTHNEGRPIIIAAHGQGSQHALRLLQEFFDGQELQKKLVAAYLVGEEVTLSSFNTLKPCENATQTQCYCSWRSYIRDYFPPSHDSRPLDVVCTNPLTWELNDLFVDAEQNQGGVLWKFERIIPNMADAQVKEGILWISKPKALLGPKGNRKDFRKVDYHLFYMNIRLNAQQRVGTYFENKQETIISSVPKRRKN